MRLLFSVVGGLLIASSSVWAAEPDAPKTGPVPEWVVPVPWELPEKYEPNTSGEDYLVIDEQVNVATEESFNQSVYQIVSKAGLQDGSQISLDFDPSYQTLTIHRVDIVRKDGRIDQLDPSKIQVLQKEKELDRQIYNGRRSALLILEDVRIGDVIDLAYTRKGRNPVFDGKFSDVSTLQYGVPVHDLRYRLIVPNGRKIAWKVMGDLKIEPETRPLGDATEFQWRRTDVPLLEDEDDVPNTIFFYPFIDLSEFASWDEVISWAEPLYETDGDPGPGVNEVIERIRTSGGTPEEQVVAALDFAQQEIRYLGVEMGTGSHRPSEPAEVMRRRFGDCKDKSRLLVTILRRLGFDAAPALVNSWRGEATKQRLPSAQPFDHVITTVDLNGKRYLLDPTMSYQRGSSIELRQVGRYGPYLRISPGGPRELEDAVEGPDDFSDTAVVHDFTVSSFDSPSTMVVTTTAKGRAADRLRSYFANNANGEISRTYLNYYTRYYRGLRLKSPVEFRDKPGDNTITTVENYEVDGLFAPEENGDLLRAEFDPPSIWDYARVPNLTARHYPYSVSHSVRLSERIVVHLHKDWEVTANKNEVIDDAFHFTSSIELTAPRTVTMDYLWESRADEVPMKRFAEYTDNVTKARGDIGYYLTWRNKVAAETPEKAPTKAPVAKSVAQPKGLNWPMVGLATAIVAIGAIVSMFLIRRKRVLAGVPPVMDENGIPVEAPGLPPLVNTQPSGLGGWLVLVAIGLFVRPGYYIYALFTGRMAYFDLPTWTRVTSPGSGAFVQHFALVAPMEMAINLGLLLFSVALIALFFRKSAIFPGCIQVFFLCLVGAGIFAVWSASMIPSDPPGTGNVEILIRAVVAAVVWIPYFRVSERVMNTFTK